MVPWILAVTILGSSMAFIDSTVVNVALPALQSSLGGTVADIKVGMPRVCACPIRWSPLRQTRS